MRFLTSVLLTLVVMMAIHTACGGPGPVYRADDCQNDMGVLVYDRGGELVDVATACSITVFNGNPKVVSLYECEVGYVSKLVIPMGYSFETTLVTLVTDYG